MPDDFGLDPELPAVLEAMDMPFVGFSRNAGNNPGNYSLSAIEPDPASNFQSWTALPDSPAARELPPCTKHTTGSLPAPYQPCLNADLTTDPAGTELIWSAQDGAQTFLHFMPGSYGQLKTADIDGAAGQAMAALTTAYKRNAAVSHRNPSGFNNYVYAPLSDDMMVPSKNILTVIKTFNCDNYWNQSPAAGCSGPRSPSRPQPDPDLPFAVLASFENFADLVSLASANSPHKLPQIGEVISTPVIDGLYATAGDIKRDQQAATNALLGAEVFGAALHQRDASLYQDYRNSLRSDPDSGCQVPSTYRNSGMNNTCWIDDGWETLAPSTHHAYVTGLAPKNVYQGEQRTVLGVSKYIGIKAREAAIDALTKTIPVRVANQPIAAVFNQLGFQRKNGLVQVDSSHFQDSPAIQILASQNKVQYSCEEHIGATGCENGLLFLSSSPSMGFQTANLRNLPALSFTNAVTLVDNCTNRALLNLSSSSLPEDYQGSIIGLLNGQMCAELAQDSQGAWSLSQVLDLRTNPQGTNLLAANSRGNELSFINERYFQDNNLNSDFSGNTFQFLYENYSVAGISDQFKILPLSQLPGASFASSRLTILEAGPVRVRIRTELVASFTTQENSSDTKHTEQLSYELDYSLVSGEPLLRMVADGQAPSNHTVVTGFTLSGANITSFLHGTPYHWIQTAAAPGWAAYNGWPGPFFYGTFNFLIPQDEAQNSSVVFYHAGITGWAAADNHLYGALWRNVEFDRAGQTYHLPVANDGDVKTGFGKPVPFKTAEYAFRLPFSGQAIAAVKNGTALRESLAFQQPMEGRLLSGNGPGRSDSYSLAQVRNLDLSTPSSLLTVGKLGSRGSDDQRDQRLIVRIYNPAGVHARLPIAVTFGESSSGGRIQAAQLSALEKSISNRAVKIPLLPLGPRTVALRPIRSLTTLCASWSGACRGQ